MITLKQLKSKLEKDFGWENLESDDNKWFVDNLLKDTIQAIEVIRCCKSDSEQLVLFADWLQYNGKWSLPEQQAKDFLKEQQEQN